MANAAERFRAAGWGWSPEQRERWVLEALRRTVSGAAAASRFYRERVAGVGIDPRTLTFDEFARLPPLTREELAEHSAAMLIADPGDPQVQKDSTGGSSGQPTVVWKGPAERAWAESGSRFFLRRHGIRPDARRALLWGHHLDARTVDSWRSRLRDLAANATWFDIFRLSPELLLDYHHRLNRLRPEYIVAYGGALAELAVVVERSGTPPAYPRVAFVTGAEKVHRHERERIERTFGVPVLERYGSRDVGLMAFQAAADAALGFEVDWPNMLIEPETSAPESPILVTKLHADAFPMIRYRVGDLARFPAGSQPGHPVFSLVEVLGRELEVVRIGPDTWLSGVNFPHLFKDFPVADFQVYQGADASVEVRIIPTAPGEWSAGVTQRFHAELTNLLADTPHTVRFVSEIPRTVANKRRPVISELARLRR